MCIPWGGTRTLPQGCTIVPWLLLPCLWVPSLPWLATVRICPLELREGHGGWSLIPTNKKRGTQKDFRAQEPHRVLLISIACPKVRPWPWCGPGKASGSSHWWHDCWKDWFPGTWLSPTPLLPYVSLVTMLCHIFKWNNTVENIIKALRCFTNYYYLRQTCDQNSGCAALFKP